MLRFLIGALLVVHGFIVGAQASGSFNPGAGVQNPAWLSWWPTALGQSWLMSKLGVERTPASWFGGVLWIVGGILLVGAGLGAAGFLVPSGLWRPLAVAGAATSLVMLVVYLHPFFGIGMLADMVILASILWAHWPSASVFGS